MIGKTPLLSICIPVYNAERFLDECLNPLVKMDRDDVQIILSDDGSTDRSLEICQSYADRHENIIVIQGENGGPSAARNRGLKKVIGEYVLFCDADDWLDEEVLIELKTILKDTGSVDFIHFGIMTETGEATINEPLFKEDSGQLSTDEYRDLLALTVGYRDERQLRFESYGLVTCKIFRASMIKDMKFDLEVVGEDTLYAVEAMMRVKKAYWLAKNLYHYRIVPGSYSHRPFEGIVPMAVKMVQRLKNVLTGEFPCSVGSTDDDVFRNAWFHHCYGKFLWCVNATGIRSMRNMKEKTEALRSICEIPEFKEAISKIDARTLTKRHRVAIFMMRLGIAGMACRCYGL